MATLVHAPCHDHRMLSEISALPLHIRTALSHALGWRDIRRRAALPARMPVGPGPLQGETKADADRTRAARYT
eukprot:gene10891-biopygen7797